MTFSANPDVASTVGSLAAPIQSLQPTSEPQFYAELVALQAEGVRLKSQLAIAGVQDWCQRAHDCLSQIALYAPSQIAAWQEMVLPLLLSSAFLRRCREQPRGYAGDYRTIQMMYEAAHVSADPFGQAIDTWSMAQPCPRAVRNRRALAGSLLKTVGAAFYRPQVASLGCGPAAEVFDLAQCSNAHFSLVDIDTEALQYVADKARVTGYSERVETIKANVIKMLIKDRGELSKNYAAIYSLGLIDYFSDDLVVRLLDFIHSKLIAGGIALLGNFRPAHPNAALFEHALKWPLVLRSEESLRSLAAKSLFAAGSVRIGSEPEGVQLFLECRK